MTFSELRALIKRDIDTMRDHPSWSLDVETWHHKSSADTLQIRLWIDNRSDLRRDTPTVQAMADIWRMEIWPQLSDRPVETDITDELARVDV